MRLDISAINCGLLEESMRTPGISSIYAEGYISPFSYQEIGNEFDGYELRGNGFQLVGSADEGLCRAVKKNS